ncbi:MAG: hypothetical protein U1E10_11365 [Bdellovibrionales bacterium]|nr:hypothetical protein [Bdellovibrionales bacterium]
MFTVSMHKSDSRKFGFAIGMLAMVVLSILMVGCASENNGGGAIPPGGIGAIPLQTCQANQIYTSTHGCLYQQSCQNGYGWVPAEGRCVPGTISNSASGTVFLTSLRITSRQTFELLLQNSGLCDPYIIGVNWGNTSCDNYSHAGYLAVQFPGLLSGATLPTQATVWVGAGAPGPNQGNTGGSWTTPGVKERSFFANIGPANNSLGFTGTPSTGNGLPGGFRFIVNNGLPGNSYQMNVDLQYNGVTFANGTLIRY